MLIPSSRFKAINSEVHFINFDMLSFHLFKMFIFHLIYSFNHELFGITLILKHSDWEFSDSLVVRTPSFHCQVPGVQSLVGKLRSCKLHGMAKNNNKKHHIQGSPNSITSRQTDGETMETMRENLGVLQNHHRWWLQP